MNNTVLFSSQNDFSAGESRGLVPAPALGRGGLALARGAQEGQFFSPVMDLEDFSTAVMCWNTDLPQGSSSEAFCRVQDQEGQWSDWLSWGLWSPFLQRTSLPEADGGCARMETDTLTMKEGRTGKALQLRLVLRRGGAEGDPALRLLGVTVRNSREDRLADSGPVGTIHNPAPAYSQMTRDPNMGFVMCSPTTAAVMMNAQGVDLLPEECALACWDKRYQGYGNWSFTIAMAASYGFESWLTFTDADGLRAQLKQGWPVGAAVSYSNTRERADERVPYVENTPGYTPGHLLTVRGVETDSAGREWALVNDSYGQPDSQAVRRYPMDQFLRAWGGLLYIIRPKLAGAGFAAPRRLPAQLKKTAFGDEFRLVCQGEEIPLDPHFNGKREDCGGVIAYTLEDGLCYPTAASRPFFYTKATANGNLFLPAEALFRASPLGDRAAITVYVMTLSGVTYLCRLTPADL